MKKKILLTVCATAAMVSAQTANIDDLKAGNGLARTAVDDAWYAYNDNNATGASS